MRNQIYKEAIQFREKHNIDISAPIDPIKLIETLGVIAVFQPLGDKFSGMAFKHKDILSMMINSNHSLGKQNFTICHELYHLCIQKDFSTAICNTELFDKRVSTIEYYADLFSSYLLIPYDGLISSIPENEMSKDRIQLRTVVEIQHKFGCSRIALLHRLNELGVISKNLQDQFTLTPMNDATNLGYSNELYKKSRNRFIGKSYKNLATKLYNKYAISESDYFLIMQDVGIDV